MSAFVAIILAITCILANCAEIPTPTSPTEPRISKSPSSSFGNGPPSINRDSSDPHKGQVTHWPPVNAAFAEPNTKILETRQNPRRPSEDWQGGYQEPWHTSPSPPEDFYPHRPKCYRPRGQFPHHVYCDRFYNCWDETVAEQKCPSGLFFHDDPNRPYCDYPRNVQCRGRIRSEDSAPTPYCPEPNGLFPYQGDCSLFFNCANRIGYLTRCPPGTLFNQDIKSCDYPYNVRCDYMWNTESSIWPEASYYADSTNNRNSIKRIS